MRETQRRRAYTVSTWMQWPMFEMIRPMDDRPGVVEPRYA